MEVPSCKVKHLIVDSAGFIKNCPLQDRGEIIYTLPEVVREIRDAETKKRLQVLPYELVFKEPAVEAIQFVTEFSKKTGDYPSLSAVDIKVLALTVQIAKEVNGDAFLRSEPKQKEVIDTSKRNDKSEAKLIAGFYYPTLEDQYESALTTEHTSLESCDPEELQDDNLDESMEIIDDEDEDEFGWITPKNFREVTKDMIGSKPQEGDKTVAVACLTSDFAMQNVLLHIGLAIISIDGFHIRETKTFILRCFSCFKTTSIMTKKFCPQCGNQTLKRVAVTMDDEGKQKMHISFRKPISIRGTKFSLPAPQGGKHSNNPILSEDQRIPQQRISNMARQKLNAIDPDYVAGSSPFALNDVYSRSANIGIRVPNGRTKNPNEGYRQKNRKRKK